MSKLSLLNALRPLGYDSNLDDVTVMQCNLNALKGNLLRQQRFLPISGTVNLILRGYGFTTTPQSLPTVADLWEALKHVEAV